MGERETEKRGEHGAGVDGWCGDVGGDGRLGGWLSEFEAHRIVANITIDQQPSSGANKRKKKQNKD